MKEKNNKKKDKDHITISISPGFYENEVVCLSTILKEYDNIEKIFTDLQYIACISLQIDQLKKIEHKYGSVACGN